MRSAIYYPFTTPRSPGFLRSALLLWDELHAIVPRRDFEHSYTGDRAKAWTIIGRNLVPQPEEQRVAHQLIEDFISRDLPEEFYWLQRNDDPYEFYPEKLLVETWDLLLRSRVAGASLPNSDYPFTAMGGYTIASKLAEACAGDTFARVTDQALAYGLVAEKLVDHLNVAADGARVVPLTLSLIDAESIPLEALIAFREREEKEQAGSQLRHLRHSYADAVQAHIARLQSVTGEAQFNEANRQFSRDMEDDLARLRTELGVSKVKLASSSAVVAAIVDGASWIAANPVIGIAKIGAGAIKAVADLFRSKVEFSEKQRQIMQAHPMAYMHALSRQKT